MKDVPKGPPFTRFRFLGNPSLLSCTNSTRLLRIDLGAIVEMWAKLERLPDYVVGRNVLSMLDYKAIARLDTAVANKNGRPVLHAFFKLATVDLPTYRLEGRMNVHALQWCITRSMQIEFSHVKELFRELLQLLSSAPNTVRGEITISCSKQADLDDIEATLLHAQANKARSFQFSFHLNGNIKFHDTAVFVGRLCGLSTSVSTVSAEDTRDLIRGNPQMSTIFIADSSVEELQLVASLGSAVQVLGLNSGNFTDEQLAVLGQGCINVRHLQMCSSRVARLLDVGLIAIALSLHELEKLFLLDISVSDAAVVALCRHCTKLQYIEISGGFVTSEALLALTVSRAPLTTMNIGWKVASLEVLCAAMDSDALSGMTSLSIVSILPEYAATLEIALSRMAALKSFSLFQDQLPGEMRIPAQVLVGLVRERSALTDLYLSCQLCGELDDILEGVLRSCPALNSFACGRSGVIVTDRLLLVMAERCKGLDYFSCTLSPTISGAAIAALVRECKKLKWLTIIGGIEVTDTMLFLLAEHCGAALHTLLLRESVHITGTAVLHVLQRCPRLRLVRIPLTVGSSEEVAEMGRILEVRGGNSKVYDFYHADL